MPPHGNADAADIRALTDLMNPQNLQSGIDLAGEEGAVVGRALGRVAPPVDTTAILGEDILSLANELGIDLTEFKDLTSAAPVAAPTLPAPAAPTLPAPAAPAPTAPASVSLGASNHPPESQASYRAVLSIGSSDGSDDGGTFGSDDDDDDDDSDDDGSDDADDAPPLSPPTVGRDRRRYLGPGESTGLIPGGELEARTHEEADRAHIDAVLGQLDGGAEGELSEFTLDREQEEEIKMQKLDKIDDLLQTLEEEDVAVEITPPSLNSSMADIDKALRRLQLKSDRIRYSALAEEVIVSGAEIIEAVFDGERAIPFFNYAPDYRGYSGTVNVKLRRMRHETSTLVGDTMRRWNIGPGLRLLIELAPSFFLYPRQQGGHNQSKALYSREQVSRASGAIRDFNDAHSI